MEGRVGGENTQPYFINFSHHCYEALLMTMAANEIFTVSLFIMFLLRKRSKVFF